MASQGESWGWAGEGTSGYAWHLWNGAVYHPKCPRVDDQAAKEQKLSVCSKTTRITQLPTPVQKLLATELQGMEGRIMEGKPIHS
jgi:hypothetical protein